MNYELTETFAVKDDNTADWALRAIRDDEAERDRLIAIANHQIEELNAQIEEIREKYDRKTAFLKGCLAMYMNDVPHKETKTQETYQLLTGKLVLKKASHKMVPNDDALVKYLETEKCSELIKVIRKPDWATVKKSLAIMDGDVVNIMTGEVIDPAIVAIEDVPASFDIKFNKEEE